MLVCLDLATGDLATDDVSDDVSDDLSLGCLDLATDDVGRRCRESIWLYVFSFKTKARQTLCVRLPCHCLPVVC